MYCWGFYTFVNTSYAFRSSCRASRAASWPWTPGASTRARSRGGGAVLCWGLNRERSTRRRHDHVPPRPRPCDRARQRSRGDLRRRRTHLRGSLRRQRALLGCQLTRTLGNGTEVYRSGTHFGQWDHERRRRCFGRGRAHLRRHGRRGRPMLGPNANGVLGHREPGPVPDRPGPRLRPVERRPGCPRRDTTTPAQSRRAVGPCAGATTSTVKWGPGRPGTGRTGTTSRSRSRGSRAA